MIIWFLSNLCSVLSWILFARCSSTVSSVFYWILFAQFLSTLTSVLSWVLFARCLQCSCQCLTRPVRQKYLQERYDIYKFRKKGWEENEQVNNVNWRKRFNLKLLEKGRYFSLNQSFCHENIIEMLAPKRVKILAMMPQNSQKRD